MPVEHHKPLRFWNYLCYGLAAFPVSLGKSTIGFFLPVFILEVAKITPAQNTILTTTSIVLSSASGIIFGFLVNATNTRWGKLKPWLLLTTFPCATCYFFLWYSPDVVSPVGKLVWYLGFYGGYLTVLMGYQNARDSLVMFASNEQRERDTLNTFLSAFEIVAVVLSALIQQGTFALFRADLGHDPCSNGTNGTDPGTGASGNTEKTAYMVAAAVGSGIIVVCGLAAVLGVPERNDINRHQQSCFPVDDLKALALHRPFLLMLLIEMLLEMGIYTKQINSALMLQYTFNMSGQVFYIIFVYMAAAVVAIFVWNLVIRRIGRKKVICLGILVFLLPHNAALLIATDELFGNALLPFLYAGTVLGGIGEGCMYIVQSVMCTDVINDFELKTGKKMAAIFYSLWVFSCSVIDAISAAVSNWVLQSVNYNADVCVQPSAVKQALRYLTAGLPPAVYLVTLVFIWLYPITEDSRMKTKMALDARRAAAGEHERTLLNSTDGITVQETA